MDISREEFDNTLRHNLCDSTLIDRVQDEKDLTFFFTYSISDAIDKSAERICGQLLLQEIKVCIITKGDYKLANIIIKK